VDWFEINGEAASIGGPFYSRRLLHIADIQCAPMNVGFWGQSRRIARLDRFRQKPGNRSCLGFFSGNIGKCSLIAANARFSYSIASTSMSKSAFSAARRRNTLASTSAAAEDMGGL
jgi:hypothetical protein